MKDFMIYSNETLLLVIDIQPRLYQAMEVPFRQAFLDNSLILIECAKACSLPLVISEQYPQGLGETMLEVGRLTEGIPRYAKMTFSCFRDPDLKQVLVETGRRSVIITGIETHVCVLQSALDLLRAGFKVVVAADAVCSRYAEDRTAAIETLRDAGALVYTTETIAFMLLERAGTPLFKKVAPLFKGA